MGKQDCKKQSLSRLDALRGAFSRGAQVMIEGVKFDFRPLASTRGDLSGFEVKNLSRLHLTKKRNATPGKRIVAWEGLSAPPALNLPWFADAISEELIQRKPWGWGIVRDDSHQSGFSIGNEVWSPAPYDLSQLTKVLVGDHVVAQWLEPLASKNSLEIHAQSRIERFKLVVWRGKKLMGESVGDFVAIPNTFSPLHWMLEANLGWDKSERGWLETINNRVRQSLVNSPDVGSGFDHITKLLFKDRNDDLHTKSDIVGAFHEDHWGALQVQLDYLMAQETLLSEQLERFPRNMNLRDSQIMRDVIHH